MNDGIGHYKHLIEFLYESITCRNIESIQHMKSVQGYTGILANKYAELYPRSRMTKKKIEMIVEASQMHDIGKIMMPDAVLHKEGRLLKSEMEMLKEHTIKGCEIVGMLFGFTGEDYSKICKNICLYHHEKYDGTGYPYGIKKDKIPIEAQIVALADMYDVMVNRGKSRESYSKERAYYMLMNGECGELSPRMKECLQSAKDSMGAFHLEE